MNNQAINIDAMVNAIVKTSKDAISSGASAENVFSSVAKILGNKGARMVLASIALDAGLEKETLSYLTK